MVSSDNALGESTMAPSPRPEGAHSGSSDDQNLKRQTRSEDPASKKARLAGGFEEHVSDSYHDSAGYSQTACIPNMIPEDALSLGDSLGRGLCGIVSSGR